MGQTQSRKNEIIFKHYLDNNESSYWTILNRKVVMMINPKEEKLDKILRFLRERELLLEEEKKDKFIELKLAVSRGITFDQIPFENFENFEEFKEIIMKIFDEIKLIHGDGTILGLVPRNGIVFEYKKKITNVVIIYAPHFLKLSELEEGGKQYLPLYKYYDLWMFFKFLIWDHLTIRKDWKEWGLRYLKEVIRKDAELNFTQLWLEIFRKSPQSFSEDFIEFISDLPKTFRQKYPLQAVRNCEFISDLPKTFRQKYPLRAVRNCEFFIKKKIGPQSSKGAKGGYGDIYFGSIEKNGEKKEVIIKLQPLKKNYQDGTWKEKIIKEKEYLISLNDRKPRIVPKYLGSFVCSQNEKLMEAIIMEKMDGNMYSYLLQNRINKEIVNGMITLIGYLHKFGFVHNDIKPDNFLYKSALGNLLDIYLVDLGLSYRVDLKRYKEDPIYRQAWKDHKLMDYFSLYVWLIGMTYRREIGYNQAKTEKMINEAFSSVWNRFKKVWKSWSDQIGKVVRERPSLHKILEKRKNWDLDTVLSNYYWDNFPHENTEPLLKVKRLIEEAGGQS